MTTLPIYRGTHRRQVGGSIFGKGFKEAIPRFFKDKVKPAMMNLGRKLGIRAVGAASDVAKDLIHKKINSRDDVKNIFVDRAKQELNIIKKVASDEIKGLKRRLDIDEEYQQGGGASKKRKTVKKTTKLKKPKKPTKTKKSAKLTKTKKPAKPKKRLQTKRKPFRRHSRKSSHAR